MERKEVKEIVLDKLSSYSGIELIIEADLFDDDLELDSLDRAEFLQMMEREFDVIISDYDAERMLTVGDLINCIYNALDKKQ